MFLLCFCVLILSCRPPFLQEMAAWLFFFWAWPIGWQADPSMWLDAMEQAIDVISGRVPVLSTEMKDGNVSVFVLFCVCVDACVASCFIQEKCLNWLWLSEMLDARRKMDLIYEEHCNRKVCPEVVIRERCRSDVKEWSLHYWEDVIDIMCLILVFTSR